MMNLLESNRKRWEAHEAAEETTTELSDAEPELMLSNGEEHLKQSPGTPSIVEFITPPQR